MSINRLGTQVSTATIMLLQWAQSEPGLARLHGRDIDALRIEASQESALPESMVQSIAFLRTVPAAPET